MAPGGGTVLKYETLEGGILRLIIWGRLDTESVGACWMEVVDRIVGAKPQRVEVDAHQMGGCDGMGIALWQELKVRQQQSRGEFHIEGLRRELAELMRETMKETGQ